MCSWASGQSKAAGKETGVAERPTLHTDRLVLRPFAMTDCADVTRLAGEREIAATTLMIPHPFYLADAERWIGAHQERFDKGDGVSWAVTRADDGALVGAVGLNITADHDRAELGYWVGVPFWGQGFATEATRAALRYGFRELKLNRIFAYHFTGNDASGRVLRKLGMIHEGCARQHMKKWGAYVDCEQYGLVRADYHPGA
jgi:ribosomal-protein-alanine N-acetyltransferase